MENVVRRSLRGGVVALTLAGAPAAAQVTPCVSLPAQPGFHWYSDPLARAESYDASLHIRSAGDVEPFRRALRLRVAGSEELSTDLPAVVILPRRAKLPTVPSARVASVKRLTVDMASSKAVAYYYEPARPKADLVIYHSGHEVVVPDSTLSAFLNAGHAVVAMYMPTAGPNAEFAPSVDHPDLGPTKMVQHGQYALLDGPGVHPLRFFVEPVTVVLNYLLRDTRFRRVTLVGLSGGGWTATVAAALDPRITRSYAIAGTVPIQLRWNDWTSWGDYEQAHPALRDSYLDMYLLAANGEGRTHTQILHKYDTCCFAMRRTPAYVATVAKRVAEIGAGRYRFVLDDTIRGHAVSPCALSRILGDLARR